MCEKLKHCPDDFWWNYRHLQLTIKLPSLGLAASEALHAFTKHSKKVIFALKAINGCLNEVSISLLI